MSFLLPERVPVKVYRWDDVGAPALDKTANCVNTIFKACLVTGYGTKEPAGWTMPFEDVDAGVKVLRPEVAPHTDFYLRCSADTGTQMSAQVYLDMTDVNNGDLKLQCATPFKYATGINTGKWILIASSRSFWFFTNTSFNDDAQRLTYSGTYFFCGDTVSLSDGQHATALLHSAGTDINHYCAGIMRSKVHVGSFSSSVESLYSASVKSIYDIKSMFNSLDALSLTVHTAPACYSHGDILFKLPGAATNSAGAQLQNLELLTDIQMGKCVVHGTSTFEPEMWLFATEFWEY